MKKSYILECIYAFFCLLFIYTAVSKLADHARFRWVLSEAPYIGWSASFVSWIIPIIELFVVALFLVKGKSLQALHASLALMTLFTIYLTVMVIVAPHLPCSCGGIIGKMSWRHHIVFNIGLIGISLLGIYLNRRWSPPRSYSYS